MIDEKTTNLSLPLPNAKNLLDEDVERLRAALMALDTESGDVRAILATVSDLLESAAETATWASVFGKPEAFPPTRHKATHSRGGADALTPADIGAQPAGEYALANDARFTDARTPTTHAASHQHGGTDPLGVLFFGLITPYYGELDATGKHPLINGVANTCWHVCDGTDDTPNMRDRIPLGASTTREMGSTEVKKPLLPPCLRRQCR